MKIYIPIYDEDKVERIREGGFETTKLPEELELLCFEVPDQQADVMYFYVDIPEEEAENFRLYDTRADRSKGEMTGTEEFQIPTRILNSYFNDRNIPSAREATEQAEADSSVE